MGHPALKICHPDTDLRDVKDCSTGGAPGFGTEASIGPQLASQSAVTGERSQGKCMYAFSFSSVFEV